MQRHTNSDCETMKGTPIQLEHRESEAMLSLIVPTAMPSDPVASVESKIPQWEWLTSGELPSGDITVAPPELANVVDLTVTTKGSTVGAEQSELHDTLPSPPPSPDDAA